MVFSSITFLLFLGVTVFLFYALERTPFRGFQLCFLIAASLFFYAWWNPAFLLLLLVSIAGNYLVCRCIVAAGKWKKTLLVCGIAANLLLIGYYKYTNFLIETVNTLFFADFSCLEILLPLGISFFTFQQIAFLVDVYSGKLQSPGSLQGYILFVCFFPQLIAGPIVHHSDVMPQFDRMPCCPEWGTMYNGLLLFLLGLGKKCLLADSLAPVVHVTFDAGISLSFADAALGTLAYALQLYFDFSGYSDMAIGGALLFGIRLPENFCSPYRAASIQDFWRRWHMTLSRWLRTYLYIPLGGNRRGSARTLLNIAVTFFLGGLWHGAAWTFVVWGLLHGCAMIVCRLWQSHVSWRMPRLAGWALTFAFVCWAWVAFRAPSLDVLGSIYASLLGRNGLEFTTAFCSLVVSRTAWGLLSFEQIQCFVLGCLAIGILAPRSVTLVQPFDAGCPSVCKTALGLCVGGLAMFLLIFPQRVQDFIYFQF